MASKPLLESKANERLRLKSIELINAYFREITLFWVDGDAKVSIEVAKCFRCLLNSGKDPDVLRADQVEW